jgi:serine/threonine-protein phosphatase PGAM5
VNPRASSSPRPSRAARRRLTSTGALTGALLLVASGAAAAAFPRTIYLVRHGEYDHQDPRPEEVGRGLVAIGVAQSRLLGARLRASGIHFDAFDASPLTRARQTAELLAEDLPGIPLRIVPDLAECTPPTRRVEVVADEPPADLEACKEKLDRLFAARFVPSPDHELSELLVAHGNVIRYFVTRALGVDTLAWLEMSVHNASLTVIRVEADGRFKVLAVGDSGHLPLGLTTGATGDPERDLAPVRFARSE